MDLSKLRDACDTGTGVDEALLLQLLGMFLDDNRERLRFLCAAVASGDLEQARRLAHTMAGSVGTAGALALSQMAKAIELDTSSGRLPDPEALTALQTEFTRVEQVILTSYPSLGPLA